MQTTIYLSIGDKIRKLRFEKGYTQENVANAVGISTYYFRKIEHGEANPTIGILEKIADEFQVSLRHLLE